MTSDPAGLVDLLAAAARIVLGAAFCVAAFGKLVHRDAFRATLREFGVKPGSARRLSVAIPVWELALAAALVPVVTAQAAGAFAAFTLLGFTAAVAVTLRAGRRPDCNCFGPGAGAPISGRTVARNLTLTALAGTVAATSDPGNLFGSPSGLRAVDVVLLAFIAVLCVAVWLLAFTAVRLTRAHGAMLRRLAALEASGHRPRPTQPHVPAQLPALQLDDLIGNRRSLRELTAHRRVALVFVAPGCGPCSTVAAQIPRWRSRFDGLRLLVVSHGTLEDTRTLCADLDPADVLLSPDGQAPGALAIPGVPAALLAGPDAVTRTAPVTGTDAIERLLADEQTTRGPAPVTVIAAGNGAASAPAAAGRPAP